MIYIVTQDGLNNYPVEDDDIIKTIVTTIGGSCKYHITLEQAAGFNGKPCITLGDYKKEETAIKVVKAISVTRARNIIANDWCPWYFMPKEDDDGEKN